MQSKLGKATLAAVCMLVVVGLLYGARVHIMSDLQNFAPAPSGPGAISAVYPLYAIGAADITWGSQLAVSLPPRSDYNPATTTLTGYQVSSLPTASTNNIAAIIEPLRDYYDKTLLSKGWAIDPNAEADGPGGSVWGYTKGNQILIFSYASTFLNQQQNQPEQCPCTIVFTIIGGALSR